MKESKDDQKDYIKRFNIGYELAQELSLKSDTLKDLAVNDNRMLAMYDGMKQYEKELIFEKDKQKENDKEIIPPYDMDTFDNRMIDKDNNVPQKDRDIDIDI